MENLIRIGSRGSKLALWQTHYIADLLHQGGFKTEIVTMETKGDKILTAPFAEIGTKGLFTEELEEKLKTGEIDIAVHSAKDMQTDLGSDLDIIAYTKREEPNDVLISFDKNFSIKDTTKEIIVGTSSTRRRAVLKHYFPHVKAVEARGNLQTRFRKMEEGQYQAMILAYAGVHRMEYDAHIIEKLPLDVFTPAVGQGSIAIESSVNVSSHKREKIRALVNDEATAPCIIAERAFLRKLQGGCSIPVFGLATLHGKQIDITGGVISLDGSQIIRETISGFITDSEKIGVELADKILSKGGDKILADIKSK